MPFHAHASKVEPAFTDEEVARKLARPTPRDSRAHQAFVAACAAHGVTPKALGRAWGVNATLAQRVLAGSWPLTGLRIDRAPTAVRLAFARALLAEAEEEAGARRETQGGCPTRGALHVASVAGELAQAVSDATADGVIDDAGRKTIARHAGRIVDAATGVVRAVRRKE